MFVCVYVGVCVVGVLNIWHHWRLNIYCAGTPVAPQPHKLKKMWIWSHISAIQNTRTHTHTILWEPYGKNCLWHYNYYLSLISLSYSFVCMCVCTCMRVCGDAQRVCSSALEINPPCWHASFSCFWKWWSRQSAASLTVHMWANVCLHFNRHPRFGPTSTSNVLVTSLSVSRSGLAALLSFLFITS